MVPVAPGDSFEDQDASRELVHQEHVGEACQGEERERGRGSSGCEDGGERN